MRLAKLILIGTVVTSVPSCMLTNAEEDEASALSSDLQQMKASHRELVQATHASVQELTKVVALLETELRATEQENEAKLSQVSSLSAELKARRQELEDQAERKRTASLLLCLIGACDVGFVGALMAIDDDARVKQLTQEIATVQSDITALTERIEDYRKKKDAAQIQLTKLKQAESHLRDVFTGRVLAQGLNDAAFAAQPDFPKVRQEFRAAGALRDNLQGQIDILSGLLAQAGALSNTADEALVRANAAKAKADKLVEESANDWVQMLKILVANDPNAAAQKWLEKRVQTLTKQLMMKVMPAGWQAETFVDRLIKQTFKSRSKSPEALSLQDTLIEELSFEVP